MDATALSYICHKYEIRIEIKHFTIIIIIIITLKNNNITITPKFILLSITVIITTTISGLLPSIGKQWPRRILNYLTTLYRLTLTTARAETDLMAAAASSCEAEDRSLPSTATRRSPLWRRPSRSAEPPGIISEM